MMGSMITLGPQNWNSDLLFFIKSHEVVYFYIRAVQQLWQIDNPMTHPASPISRISFYITMALVIASVLSGQCGAQESGTQESVDLFSPVAEIFETRCIACHRPHDPRGGLSIQTRQSLLAGGESGPAIVEQELADSSTGQASQSLLMQMIGGQQPLMPKDSPKLSEQEIRAIHAWLQAGAPWPAGRVLSDQTLADNNWWSLKPIALPPTFSPPSVNCPSHLDNCQNPIDQFILSRLHSEGLTLSPAADKRSLIRRLSFDLLGLPPTFQQVDDFLKDSDPMAYNRLVDRMLGSPLYGQRWARHWMDVVHFGETHGYDKDQPRPNAWPYRDYLVRSFNEDKAYSRFILEQVAGDAMFPDSRDGIEALGMIACGPWDLIGHAEVSEAKIDGKIARHLDRDNMVATIIGTFCSVTIQCAQCHQHKFDPITQEDYYSLQSVFAALDRTDRLYDIDPAVAKQRAKLQAERSQAQDTINQMQELAQQRCSSLLVELDKQIQAAKSQSLDAEDVNKLKQSRILIVQACLGSANAEKLATAQTQLLDTQAALDQLPSQSKVYAGTIHHGSGAFQGTGGNKGRPRIISVLARGDVRKPTSVATPGTFALDALPNRFDVPEGADESLRRIALANWIASKDNPLTWRSIVNRVWQYHFGTGIVDSANDFGRMGGLPSHPELLDWLAITFRDEMQGSIKQLHRLIVTSATYRQSSMIQLSQGDSRDNSSGHLKAQQVEAQNRLLWKVSRRKLDAEAFRDAVLAASGQMDWTMDGPSFQDFVVVQPEHSPHYEYHLHDPNDPRTHRRSIYRFLVRSKPQPFMSCLDCADPSLRVDKRNESYSPQQALALLNNGLIVSMAQAMADQLMAASDQPAEQVQQLFRRGLQRPPSDSEQELFVEYIRRHGPANACRVIFSLNEFMFVD
jgi:mono/diheme cytochrome c family protein